MNETTWFSEVTSPVGPMVLTATLAGVSGVYFAGQRWFPTETRGWVRDRERLTGLARWLEGYFAGAEEAYSGPLAARGTAFQARVWEALRELPRGTTATYRQIATTIGQPAAVRAVGAAIGRNPISVIIPCHRVVGSSGALTGYAGGLERKAFLLRLEGWCGLPAQGTIPPPAAAGS